MRTNNEAVYDSYEFSISQNPNGSPECGLTATGYFANGFSFRVDIAIIGPKTEQPQRDLTLSRSQAQGILKAISDTIKSLQEELR